MLGSGNKNALPHQAGGVAYARDVAPTSRDRKIIQVRTQENDAGGGGRWQDSNRNRNTAMQSDAARFHRALDGGLKTHSRSLLGVTARSHFDFDPRVHSTSKEPYTLVF